MEITWYGLSCYKLTEKKMATIITDPYDNNVVGYEPLKLKADIITISHDAPGHNFVSAVKGSSHVIKGAGEFEIGGVFITGVQTDATGRKAGNFPQNTLYVFDYDGLTVAHLGDLHSVPTQAEVEALGNVNVVMVPVGGGAGLNAAKAAEVVSLLEPNIVIPMHYSTPGVKLDLDRVEKFLKEMGLHDAETLPSLSIKGSLPDETQVVLLQYQNQSS